MKKIMFVFCFAVIVCFVISKTIRHVEKRQIQKITGFTWPSETKEIQWMHSSMQGSWIKVHLSLPDSFNINTSRFYRLDLSSDVIEEHLAKQRLVFNERGGLFLFDSMESKPRISTNILFKTYDPLGKPFGKGQNVNWAIVYDEITHQMWIHCF